MQVDKRGIVDRIEDDIVVIEIDGETFDYPKERFSKEIKEGDVVDFIADQIVINREETTKRKSKIEKLMKDLWEE